MKITIHRGTDEIGGTCIRIESQNTKLLIDLGQPLAYDCNSLPTDISDIDGVLISHPHQDHFGLIQLLPDDMPVYIGKLSQKLIQAPRMFLDKPLLTNNFHHYKAWESFKIGDIKITPYLVDHSATDAYSFSIEADGKHIFYSGDFRANGRKSKLFDSLIAKPPKNIDVLLMEGTLIQSSIEIEARPGEFPDEQSVENKIVEVLTNHPSVGFLIGSSQNIDRLVSAYRACLKTNRTFVVDIYTSWVLKELSKFSDNTPNINWKQIKVLAKGWTAGRHYGKVKDNPDYFDGFIREIYKENNFISTEEIKKSPNQYFIKTSFIDAIAKGIECDNMAVIYSQWKGYMEEEYNENGFKRLTTLRDDPNVEFVYAHTSGHATLKVLKQFAKALAPKKLVPIHTENKSKFVEHFDNVMILEDNLTFKL